MSDIKEDVQEAADKAMADSQFDRMMAFLQGQEARMMVQITSNNNQVVDLVSGELEKSRAQLSVVSAKVEDLRTENSAQFQSVHTDIAALKAADAAAGHDRDEMCVEMHE